MIILKNKGALANPVSLSIGNNIVPFDSLVANTNNATDWNSDKNAVVMQSAGRYNTSCTAVVSCTAGGTATLSLMANGGELTGDFVTETIEASGVQTLVLNVPVSVIRSAGDDSILQWNINVTAASTLTNAFATVQGIR